MSKTWVLIADSARARLFEIEPSDKGLSEVACFNNPDGHALGRGTATDRLPRVNESVGPVRHAIEPHTSLREKSTDHFAHGLSETLERGYHDHLYERLVLVAPDRFLGMLHKNFSKTLIACIAGEVRHNLTALPVSELQSRLPRNMLSPGLMRS